MFDNICTLPLPSDVFTQAIHPTEPIFSVGLSSGHVRTFRLPSLPDCDASGTQANKLGKRRFVDSNGRRLSENGLDTIDTIWQTRRHKGSCRALAFSSDGNTLFSTGTDGIVKAAVTETGMVTSKVAIPLDGHNNALMQNAPSVLQALSPQSLLLGTDSGRLHIYDLRNPHSSLRNNARPDQTLRPHATHAEPSFAEPLTSMTALPPAAASTSGMSRAWVTTSASTLALSDLRKGVVSVSQDQGDLLLSTACVSGLGLSTKRRRLNDGAFLERGEKILVGGAQGILTLWDRGHWEDQSGRFMVHKDLQGDDDGTVESIAVLPEILEPVASQTRHRTVVAGLGIGEIQFLRLRGGVGQLCGSFKHDESGVDGVVALGFDVAGRLISGGGQCVKVWRRNFAERNETGESGDDEEDSDDASLDSSISGDELEDNSCASGNEHGSKNRTKRKRRKRSKGKIPKKGSNISIIRGID